MELTPRRSFTSLANTYGDEALAHQITEEENMVLVGRDRIRKAIESAREKGRESNTRYGQAIIASSVDTIAEEIRAFISHAESGASGRRHRATPYLKMVDPEVAAYIALRVVVDNLNSDKPKLQRIAVSIGARIEDEVRFHLMSEANPIFYKRAMERARSSTTYERRKHVVSGFERGADRANAEAEARDYLGIPEGVSVEDSGQQEAFAAYVEREAERAAWKDWPEEDQLHVGSALVNMLTASDLVTVGKRIVTKKHTDRVIEPTPRLTEWIEKDIEREEVMWPAHRPMVVPPMHWTNPFNGGYLTRQGQGKNNLVKTGNFNYLQEMADRSSEMPMVYDAVNALQDTPWAVNQRVLDTAMEIWEAQSAAPAEVLPARDDHDTCACPRCGMPVSLPKLNTRGSMEHECFEDEDVLKEWKRNAYDVHTSNVSLHSKRAVASRTLRTAQQMSAYPEIFFPYQLDFRGRIYAMPSFGPQGPDLTKGLLHFAEGKPIEDGVAAGWLAIQGANTFGYDKASLEDRIEWVEQHEERIVAVAGDPIGESWWHEADDPWQFLAFCFEWAEFLEQGYGMMSHLPVGMDGSCSGIQHFSAMLRDEEGGEAVNLLPSDKPSDIYQRVCDKVVSKLEDKSRQLGGTIAYATSYDVMDKDGDRRGGVLANEVTGDSSSYTKASFVIPYDTPRDEVTEAQWALAWMALGLNRKTTKRQVMTLPYGSTQYSCREYTHVWLNEKLADLGSQPRPWHKSLDFSATLFLSKLIWESIREVVTSAREAMDWLQSCAKIVAKEGLPVYWKTPSGFPVMQRYNDTTSKRVKTRIGDEIIKVSLQSEVADQINQQKMANSISPNFVHSMDAAHLVLSVAYAVREGIGSFAMVHDSFGTHAADANDFAAYLREAFVDIYRDTDVLDDFRHQIADQVDPESIGDIKPVPAKGDLDIEAVRESDFFFA